MRSRGSKWLRLFPNVSKVDGNFVLLSSNFYLLVTTKLYLRPGNWTVVVFAKNCSDWIAKNGITTTQNSHHEVRVKHFSREPHSVLDYQQLGRLFNSLSRVAKSEAAVVSMVFRSYDICQMNGFYVTKYRNSLNSINSTEIVISVFQL